MTEEEVKKAEERLIKEANRKSAVERREYERKEYEERCRASERRTARSSILTDILEALKTDFNDKIDEIQNELNEKLEDLYSRNDVAETPPGGSGGEDAPYEVDYTLPMRERYVAVKNYYLGLPDKAAALAAFEADEIAKDYLGSYYDYLYQLLLMIQV